MIDMTPGEQRASELILEAMHAVQEMDGERLAYNEDELAQAVHVMQSFVKQHALHRMAPQSWGSWYRPRRPTNRDIAEGVKEPW